MEYITRTVTINREGLVKVSRGGLDTDFADAAAAAAGVALARGRRNCWVNPLADFFFAFVFFFRWILLTIKKVRGLAFLDQHGEQLFATKCFFFRFAVTLFFSW